MNRDIIQTSGVANHLPQLSEALEEEAPGRVAAKRALIVFSHNLDHARPQVRHLMGLLTRHGIETDIIGPIDPSLSITGVRILPVPTGFGRWSTLASVLRGLCRSWRTTYQVTVGFDEPGAMALWPALLRSRSNVILYYLEYFDDKPGSRVQRLGRMVLKRWGAQARLIIDVNEQRADRRKAGLPPMAKQAVIHNAPPKDARPQSTFDPLLGGAGKNAIKLIYAGAINERVYLDIAIKAMRQVSSEVRFFIIGDNRSAYGRKLEQLAEAMDCAQRVIFGGLIPRERLLSIYSLADLGLALYGTCPPVEQNEVLCSPNKVYEYMAAGLPVICSNNKTMVELVEGNEWGVCVPPSEPALLANAINQLAARPDLRKAMSARAKQLHLARMNFEAQSRPLLSIIGAR